MFFATGNEQLDEAAYAILDASMRGDAAVVFKTLPYMRAAIADLPLSDTCKRALMVQFDEMVNELCAEVAQ